MPPPDNAEGRPASRPSESLTLTSATITLPSVPRALIAVIGVAYPPAARRRRWLSVVERCPHCRGAHVHRGQEDEPVSGPRKSGCGGGPYHVIPQPRGQAS
jgi:hypothetical protein